MGSNGQFDDGSLDINIPERPGLKIHANGETTCGGGADPVMCGTLGCIRIDAMAMQALCNYARDEAGSDPLTQITITGNPMSDEANPSTVTIDDSGDDNSVDAISGGDPLGDDDLFGGFDD